MIEDMVEQDVMNCPKCAEKYPFLKPLSENVIWLYTEWRGGKCRYIVFFEGPSVQWRFGEWVKTFPVKLTRSPSEKKGAYDYKISCPLCGEFTMEVKCVPRATDVFCGADRGHKLVFFEWKPTKKLGK